MGRTVHLYLIMFLCVIVCACDAISPPPKKHVTLFERIADFKKLPPPHFHSKTDILWNAQGVPYIISNNDDDAAFALGMVQAHLRLGQMEVARHAVQGRLSESLGTYFNDIDHTLRIVDFYKAVPDILRKMPPQSRDWLQNFVAGINYYKKNLPRTPYDFDMFAFDHNEPWLEADAIALGKLGGTDLHWILFSKLLPLLRDNSPEKLLALEKEFYDKAQTGFSPDMISGINSGKDSGKSHSETLLSLLKMFNKSGSNAYAISGKKSQTKSPLFAADPHLGIFLPNFWLMAGVRSPSYHVVGMMAPGTPVFAFGRNENLAWGGTNLRAIQSHFVDITDKSKKYPLIEKETVIKNRWWFDKTYRVRSSDMGVIISDSKLFPELKHKTVALKWLGHYPTDEITAMLHVSQAKNGLEFRESLKDFGLPAQNMIFADSSGNIGNVLATTLTNRPAEFPKTLWSTPTEVKKDYNTIHNATTLPTLMNPQSGYVASANNIPVKGGAIPLISWYTSSSERIKRLQDILSQNRFYSVADMMVFQKDTYSRSSVALRDALIHHLNCMKYTDFKQDFSDADAVIMTLRDWDGTYNADSRGALLLEGFLDGVLKPLYRETGKKDILARLDQDSRLVGYTADLLQSLSTEHAKPIIIQGLNRARQLGETYHVWGDIHRMKLGHIASSIPVIGSRYIVDEFPVSGNRETLMKTSSNRTPMPHRVSYGSNARQVSDLSNIDNNYFILLGGQDSVQGSENFMDQVYLWRIGHYIQMPLSTQKINTLFPFKTIFSSYNTELNDE
jgi:penicillin G amidase